MRIGTLLCAASEGYITLIFVSNLTSCIRELVMHVVTMGVSLEHAVSHSLQLHVAGMEEVYKMQQPRKGGQWLVQARTDGLLTVMTPIYPDKQNLALLLNQVHACAAVVTSSARCSQPDPYFHDTAHSAQLTCRTLHVMRIYLVRRRALQHGNTRSIG